MSCGAAGRPGYGTLRHDEGHIESLIAGMGGEFHADVHALRRAVRNPSSDNVIHLATSTHVDLPESARREARADRPS